MNDESTLRIKAREAMEAGKLPHLRPARMWGGPGTGAECAICLQPIHRDEIGFELDFAADGAGWNETVYYIHVPCFSAWDRERAELDPHSGRRRASAAPQQIHGKIPQGLADVAASSAVPGALLPSSKKDGTISAQNDDLLPARERNRTYRRRPG